jgi:Tfp pilus assembly protein PilN
MDLIEINLLPVEQRRVKKDFSYLFDYRVLIPTLALVVTLLAYPVAVNFLGDFEEKQQTLTRLEIEISKNQKTWTQIRELEKVLEEKKAKNNSLRNITYNKQLWVRILEGINISLPANTWIAEIVQNPGQTDVLTLRGSTYVFSEVASFMIALEENEYFNNVQLQQIEITSQVSEEFFNFTLICTINLSLGSKGALEDVNLDSSEATTTGLP